VYGVPVGSATCRRRLLSVALAAIALLVALPASPAKADDTLYMLVNAASGKYLDLEHWGTEDTSSSTRVADSPTRRSSSWEIPTQLGERARPVPAVQ
jgi:hypothetical protein